MKRNVYYKYIVCALLSLTIFAGLFFAKSIHAEDNVITSYTSDMEYDVNTGYYVQTTVIVKEYYDSISNCNVRSTETIVMYYSFDGSAYTLESRRSTTQNEYSPVPLPSPSMLPEATITPQETALPTEEPYDPGEDINKIEFDTKPISFSAARKSAAQAKISWKSNKKADGYYIFRAATEYGDYNKIKTIKDYSITSYTDKGLKSDKKYYYKVQAYLHTENGIITTQMPEAEQVSKLKTQSLLNKLKKLKKMFPDGKYWNHVGYKVSVGQSTYGFVTDKPCNHKGAPNGVASTCNKYSVKVNNTTMTGYQCYGFANMIGDKLFGHTKIKVHHSYKKAKVGDHVRYGNHSVVIIEKHSKYIKVVECNIGNTCMIKWGRKISKTALAGATYYTR